MSVHRVWLISARLQKSVGITRLKRVFLLAAWRNASSQCSGTPASSALTTSSLLSPWLPTWTSHQKSPVYNAALSQPITTQRVNDACVCEKTVQTTLAERVEIKHTCTRRNSRSQEETPKEHTWTSLFSPKRFFMH